MTSEWKKKVRLSECASFQEGYVNPSQQDASYFGNDIKWLRATDLNDGFVFETSRRLSHKGFESAGKSATLFAPNTLAISKSGTIGRIGILKDFMCGNRAVINIKPNELCDSRFIFYTLLLNRQTIETLAEGSVQKNLYVSSLGSLEIEVPSLLEQKKIADTLGAIDDRIALLRETNATLEAMAQALFKSWFVDFDPVQAKANGLTPAGLSTEVAALFPDRFEDSALGPIPQGWRVGKLADCCVRIEAGGTPKRANPEYWDGDISWLSSGEVRQPIVFETKEKITELGVKESSAKIWPEGTTVVAMYGATAGEVCLLAKPTTANQACCGLIPQAHVRAYLFFCTRREREQLASKSSGSAQQNLNKGLISNHQILVPSSAALNAYEDSIGSLLDSWMANEQQAQTLATLRDTLLPRLISGQLRLPEAEAAVAEAV